MVAGTRTKPLYMGHLLYLQSYQDFSTSDYISFFKRNLLNTQLYNSRLMKKQTDSTIVSFGSTSSKSYHYELLLLTIKNCFDGKYVLRFGPSSLTYLMDHFSFMTPDVCRLKAEMPTIPLQ